MGKRGVAYIPGDYLVMDDITGQICHASETLINWKGERVHWENYEERNPQDEPIKIRREIRVVDNPRPLKTQEKLEGEM